MVCRKIVTARVAVFSAWITGRTATRRKSPTTALHCVRFAASCDTCPENVPATLAASPVWKRVSFRMPLTSAWIFCCCVRLADVVPRERA